MGTPFYGTLHGVKQILDDIIGADILGLGLKA